MLVSFVMRKEQRTKLLALGLILLVAGAVVFYISNPAKQESITVGTGWVQAVAPPYFNINVTASQIERAYVVNLNDWNVSISTRTAGTAFGGFLAGYFKLSNGANAEVLTTGESDLVLVLQSGTYVVLGPADFQAFLTSFDQSVTTAAGQ